MVLGLALVGIMARGWRCAEVAAFCSAVPRGGPSNRNCGDAVMAMAPATAAPYLALIATPRQPEKNSTAGCASTERAPRQLDATEGATARRHALSASTWRHVSSQSTAARPSDSYLYRAPRQPERSSAVVACATTERSSAVACGVRSTIESTRGPVPGR
jgi:hypothetical protein